MTGYAQARAEHRGWVVRVSVKSVNHRFLDLKLRTPEGFDAYEIRLRQIVRERIHRGHVEVHVSAEPAAGAALQVNGPLLQAYLRAVQELQKRIDSSEPLDAVALLRLPGVAGGMGIVVPEDEAAQAALGRVLEDCLYEALSRLDEMRRTEGRQLAADMRARIALLAGHAERVRELSAKLQPAFASRLAARLADLLGGAAVDPARLAQEAALLAERSDISEELERLRSHILQFASLLDGTSEPGKKLDFLLQEMNREANTTLSKTPGVGKEALAITSLGLEMKSEIEKLREQVQNIE
jgi:uncharacterized protein (TIGR00255 family)